LAQVAAPGKRGLRGATPGTKRFGRAWRTALVLSRIAEKRMPVFGLKSRGIKGI